MARSVKSLRGTEELDTKPAEPFLAAMSVPAELLSLQKVLNLSSVLELAPRAFQ